MSLSPAGYLHGSALAIDGAGVLIRGRSGAGKSTLAMALVRLARQHGLTAGFVADDRVHVAWQGDALFIAPHPEIAGLVDTREYGIRLVWNIASAPLRLTIDLDGLAAMHDEPNRDAFLQGDAENLLGARIFRLKFYPRPPAEQVFPLVLAALAK